jgi:acyl dehydratase
MASIRERAAEGLEAGDSFQTTRTFTHDDITHFAQISRDYNPVHFDVRFAKARNFAAPICYGLLTASLVTEIGGQIGWLASDMNFRFKGPVYPGEKLSCSMRITAVDRRGRAKASVTITKHDGTTVIEAEIGGIVPGLEERNVLKQMLSEGDPTNGPTNTTHCPTAESVT